MTDGTPAAPATAWSNYIAEFVAFRSVPARFPKPKFNKPSLTSACFRRVKRR